MFIKEISYLIIDNHPDDCIAPGQADSTKDNQSFVTGISKEDIYTLYKESA